MAKRPTISSITTGYSSTTLLNNNFEALRNAFDNTLSLDGSSPNSLSSDLDINSNDITNAKSVTTSELILGGTKVVNLASTLTFIGAWGASTSYTLNNIVTNSGNAYISLIAHTSGSTFSSDLSAGKWALLASKGASGSGSGDLLASNNLSDLASASTALGNLGLSATATELNYTDGVTSNIQTQFSNVQTQLDARNAQAQSAWTTGTSTTEGIVSPAKIKAFGDVLVNLNSASANSYIILNGLYVQWLSASLDLDEDLDKTVTFPVEFPNNVFNVFTTTEINSGVSMDAFDIYVKTKSTTSAVLKVAADTSASQGTGTVHVLAIGN